MQLSAIVPPAFAANAFINLQSLPGNRLEKPLGTPWATGWKKK